MKAMPTPVATINKQAVLALMELWRQGRFKEGLPYFSPDCQTHNPYIAGSIGTLVDGQVSASKQMAPQNPDAEFKVKSILADGDLVVVYTQLFFDKAKPGAGGLRQAHLFRFAGNKIAEYWDITQLLTPDQPNAAGAF
jgi:predicted SnoaL-like aldol condensation-catalyzing enzyme